jgi:hypothetical protein
VAGYLVGKEVTLVACVTELAEELRDAAWQVDDREDEQQALVFAGGS